MKRCLQVLLMFFTVLDVFTACRKDDMAAKFLSPKISQGDIAGVNGPTTGKADELLTFSVIWNTSDSTQRFDHLVDSANHNTRIIKLFSKTVNRDTLKIDTAEKSIVYKFKAAVPGVYYLKFYNAANTDKAAIIDTVTIH